MSACQSIIHMILKYKLASAGLIPLMSVCPLCLVTLTNPMALLWVLLSAVSGVSCQCQPTSKAVCEIGHQEDAMLNST
ncbi:hypothetical protein HD806DRAFT_474634 [Xylariaceae sp. AK1471]|nr:hypothetical protein HD806DRAFT_474634 [Xylariaceae sp. AK1471]